MKLFQYLALFLIIPQYLCAQQNVNDSLNKYIEPIAAKATDPQNFSSIIEVLRTKQIVSLGESSHGTKEIYAAKSAIIKTLIEKENFKTIFVETDYAALIHLNQIIQNQNDTTLLKKFKQKGIYSIYKTKEVYQLFDEVRKYNLQHNLSEKVSIIGVDMQDLVMIANRVLYEFPDSGKTNLNIYKTLIALKNIFSTGKLIKFSKAEHQSNLKAIALLKENAAVQKEARLILLIRMLEQSYEMMNTENDASRRDLRDKFMAENIIWISENFANQGKSIVWAHNSHIANVPSFTRKTLGSYLKPKFKKQLYTVAFMFGEGNVRILDPYQENYQERYIIKSVNPKAIENMLMGANSFAFFLDFSEVSKSGYLLNEIKLHSYMRSIGTTFFKEEKFTMGKEPILDCFDGVVFFKNSNAAEGL